LPTTNKNKIDYFLASMHIFSEINLPHKIKELRWKSYVLSIFTKITKAEYIPVGTNVLTPLVSIQFDLITD
jgi:hypothetical protein